MHSIEILGFNKDQLQAAVDSNWVSKTKHPNEDLWIYNYTPRAAYAKHWDDVTLNCRGLILDKQCNIVARSMPKFFNLGEHSRSDITLSKPFIVQEKVDGSLGILYPSSDGPRIATRGSFSSNQAIEANKILREKYWDFYCDIEDHLLDYTFLFEIIYPENRIVLDYGDMQDLISLTVIEIATGNEMDARDFDWPGPVVKVHELPEGARIPPRNIHEHFAFMGDGSAEGFVLKFPHKTPPVRIKVKFDEYVRLHRIITNTSTKTVWEYLSQGWDFDELLETVPDEFYDFVTETEGSLRDQYAVIEREAAELFREVAMEQQEGGDRREFALRATKTKYPAILFAMLDGKDYSRMIWKMIEPEYAKPFYSTGNIPKEAPAVVTGERKPAVIFDRDGTLASVDWSRQFVNPSEGKKKNWNAFNAHVIHDPVIPAVAAILKNLRPDVHRIMTTGRTDDLRGVMLEWIEKHELPIDTLLMRRTGDNRKDSIVKTEIYREHIEPYYDVLYVIDDRPQVVEAWKALGLPVIAVTDPGILPEHGGKWSYE